MRVLTITNWYPPHHFGGYELSCFDVMTRFEQRGHAVLVLCNEERLRGVAGAETEHEASVRRELRSYVRGGELLKPTLRERLELERHNQLALKRALAEFEPDVVSVWQIGGLSLGMLTTLVERRLPIVYAACDLWLTYATVLDTWAGLFNGRAWRRLAGRVVRPWAGVPTVLPDLSRSGAFCFVSELIRRKSAERSPWSSFPISTVVYSGIERSLFPKLLEPPIRPWRWRLLYVGRLDPRKGVETLVRALPALPPDATLSMFGRGTQAEQARLEALADELGVKPRIRFGELERHELARAYSHADVLVFPSEWEEPFGLVPIEAMACGTPVLATGVGGSGEILRDGQNCVLFRAGDPAALAAGIRRLASAPELRARIVAGGLRLADTFTTDRLADIFEAWHCAAVSRYREGLPRDAAPPLD